MKPPEIAKRNSRPKPLDVQRRPASAGHLRFKLALTGSGRPPPQAQIQAGPRRTLSRQIQTRRFFSQELAGGRGSESHPRPLGHARERRSRNFDVQKAH